MDSGVRKRSDNKEEKVSSPGKGKDRDLSSLVGKDNIEKISHLFDKVYPIFVALGNVLNVIWPYISMAITKAQQLWYFSFIFFFFLFFPSVVHVTF